MKISFKKLFSLIFNRMFFFYLIIIVAAVSLVDTAQIKQRVKIRVLNDNMPASFSYLITLGGGEPVDDIDQEWLEVYENYYEKVVYYVPNLAEAHMMLGFSYYYLGKTEKSLGELKKAAVLNPHFFWSQYNVGVMHYLEGDYASSIEVFTRTKQLRPETALTVIKQSVVYQRALRGVANLGDIAMSKMKSGYSETYRLLVLSCLKEKDYASAIRYAKEAISLGLGHKEMFLYYMAQASYELKHYTSSIPLLKEALTIDSQYSDAYHLLGLNLEAIGQNQMATEMLTREAALKKAGIEKHPKEDEVRLRVL